MSRAVEHAEVNLPKTMGAWTRTDEIRMILPEKIFDYMDGAGELYLGYRFKYLEVAEYSAPDEEKITVELYWMESANDAFGLLSGDWGGEPVDFDNTTKAGGPSWFPRRTALYGAGLLRIWSDDLYARVLAIKESTRSKEAVLRLGKIITEGRRAADAPALLEALQQVSAGYRLRVDRVCYFRSHLVLNSIYFLGTGNILGLDRSAEAVTASFFPTGKTAGNRPVQLVLIRYADEKAAEKGLAHFEQAYLPEKGKDAPDAPSNEDQFWKIEDGWLGYARRGRVLAMAFECPDRKSAVGFINESIKRLNSLETRHE